MSRKKTWPMAGLRVGMWWPRPKDMPGTGTSTLVTLHAHLPNDGNRELVAHLTQAEARELRNNLNFWLRAEWNDQMGDKINFTKTNRIDDPGENLTPAEVAERFWASEEAQEWHALVKANKSVIPLDRLALSWVPQNIGGWDDDRSIWPRISDAIFDARPWKDEG